MFQNVDMKETIADNKHTVATVKDTWEDFLARLLVHGERKSTYIKRFDTYDEMIHNVIHNDSYYSALIDYNVAAVRMQQIRADGLGNSDFVLFIIV